MNVRISRSHSGYRTQGGREWLPIFCCQSSQILGALAHFDFAQFCVKLIEKLN